MKTIISFTLLLFCFNNLNFVSSIKEEKRVNNLISMVNILKDKITNDELKSNLTPEKIADFFSHFLSGNEFYNNIQVADFSNADEIEVRDNLRVNGNMNVNEIYFKNGMNISKFNSDDSVMTVNENNEILVKDDAELKLKNYPIKFKVRDVFEVISFLKFMIRTCGEKMEKCDFETLTKEKINFDRNNFINNLKDKFKRMKDEIKSVTSRDDVKNISKSNSTNSSYYLNNTYNISILDKLYHNTNQNFPNATEKSIHKTKSNFNFKEMKSKKHSTDNLKETKKDSLFLVNKQIEKEIDLEFNNYKENNVNDFDGFLTNPELQAYAERYYYGS